MPSPIRRPSDLALGLTFTACSSHTASYGFALGSFDDAGADDAARDAGSKDATAKDSATEDGSVLPDADARKEDAPNPCCAPPYGTPPPPVFDAGDVGEDAGLLKDARSKG